MHLFGDNMGTRYRPLVGHPAGVTGRGMGQQAPCQRRFTSGPHFNAKSPAAPTDAPRRHGADVDRGPRRHAGYVDTGGNVDTKLGHVVPSRVRVPPVRVARVRVAPCESAPCERFGSGRGRASPPCWGWSPPQRRSPRRGPAQPA